MFIVKIKNNSDWNYYEAKDFQFLKPENPISKGDDLIWQHENGFEERHAIDDFVPQDLGPANSHIKLLLLRQYDDTVVTVAFTQEAYVMNEQGVTIDKL